MALYERHSGGNGSGLDFGALAVGAAVGFFAGLAANPARKATLQGLEAATQGDWVEILKAEHKATLAALDALLKTDESQKSRRQTLLTQIAHSLNKHAISEENVIYPALRDKDEQAAKKLFSEHADIKMDLSSLQYGLKKDDPAWLARVRKLREEIATHAKEEEEELFPLLRSKITDAESEKLTRRLHWESLKVA